MVSPRWLSVGCEVRMDAKELMRLAAWFVIGLGTLAAVCLFVAGLLGLFRKA
jgi:hypothetical protein